jgi:hypothetical protein
VRQAPRLLPDRDPCLRCCVPHVAERRAIRNVVGTGGSFGRSAQTAPTQPTSRSPHTASNGSRAKDEPISRTKLDRPGWLARTLTEPTSLPATTRDDADTVRSYKSLNLVERAFRCLKTVDLHVRPVYHWLADRVVRAHVFLSMPAYYLE